MTKDNVIAALAGLSGPDLMEVAQAATRGLTDEQHLEFRIWNSGDEVRRREQHAAALRGRRDMVAELRKAGMIPTPVAEADSVAGFTEWKAPASEMLQPMAGDRYRARGRVWESTVDFNSAEPGLPSSAGWVDVTDALFPPVVKAVAYKANQHWKTGDRVTFEGVEFECVAGHFAPEGWTPKTADGYWAPAVTDEETDTDTDTDLEKENSNG